jgi:phospholipid/cholesterol/gamma-HCH transport system substrate-binding protein
VSSCATEVIVPFADDRLVDKAFPTHGPVYQELGTFLPNLAGESRSFDANSPWFKVLGGAGAETLNLGNGVFGSALEPIAGNNPPPVRTRPALRPDVPCETQEPPDLRSTPRGVAAAIPNASATSAREAKARAAAVAVVREQLEGTGRKVADRVATLADIRAVARRNGLSAQLERTLRGSAKP